MNGGCLPGISHYSTDNTSMKNSSLQVIVLGLNLAINLARAASSLQDLLPPMLPWHGASEKLIAKPDDPWITPSEKTDLTDTPNYEETITYLRKLVAASPLLSLQEFGRSAE